MNSPASPTHSLFAQTSPTAVVTALRATIRGEVDASRRRRAEYSSDASIYRVVPQAVVFPANIADAVLALDLLRELRVPVTARCGGTSIAGNSIGAGVVMDYTPHCNRIIAIDVAGATATVEPGVIMSNLQAALRPHGLRFGPDPSAQDRAAFGGMIGNNACGPHAVAWGRTADNVLELDCLDGQGRRFTAGAGDPTFAAVPGLAELVRDNLALIRTEFGKFSRQISGYSLEHLLPENGSDLAKALVGTEATCVTVLGAKLRLVPLPSAPTLVVLGYPDMPTAADDVPALLNLTGPGRPLAIEGLDARLVDVVRAAKGADSVPALPEGGGWLLIEVSGSDEAEALAHAEAVVAVANAPTSRIVPAGPDATRMWQIRADGAGLAGRTPPTVGAPNGKQAWAGWEDSAVPPQHLGSYLRDLEALMASYGVDGLPYGHFGDGCVHIRIDFPMDHNSEVFTAFMRDAAHLVKRYHGSLSGEHGDGRARSQLLDIMYSPAALNLLGQFKALFDPQNLLNPGVIVAPVPISADVRRPLAHRLDAHRHGAGRGFSFPEDGGNLTDAIHRCVGIGKCRAGVFSPRSATGGRTNFGASFMCPSFVATQDEKDATRGRARVLQDALTGRLITSLTDEAVLDSLDLCLNCKACVSDCPAVVDIARMKSEVLNRKYAGRLRPRDHYVLGWLPRWIRLIGTFAPFVPLINRVLAIRPIGKTVLRAGGLDSRRSLAPFARTPFSKTPQGQPAREVNPRALAGPDGRPKVVLWTDSFSEGIAPNVPQAALRVLDAAGYDVIIPRSACCGLTWISTGQLEGARRKLRHLLSVLGPFAVNGIPIVGLEPSCTAVLRSDLLDLLPSDKRAHAVAAATRTVAELLTDPATAPVGWQPPDLSDLTAVVQPHCHHHAVLGFAADEALLRGAGAQVDVLAGCCGLAGNFGMQAGHYDLSVKVAEHQLLPALRTAEPSAEFLADGFSCRTQAEQLAGVRGKALVEVLADRL